MSEADIEKVSEWFMEILLSAKHRGAVDFVHNGFAWLCTRLWTCPNPELRKLPLSWLHRIITQLQNPDSSEENKDSFSFTRRSAGLPYLMQAVLSTEPVTETHALRTTIDALLKLAGDVDNEEQLLSRIHALNLLRVLLRDAALGSRIMPHIADAVRIAVLNFASSHFVVRNSAMMVFTSLQQRIFGVKRVRDEYSKQNNMPSREFFTRFPSLHPFLLEQLQIGKSEDQQGRLYPLLYPVLLLLARLLPSPMEALDSTLQMLAFRPLVEYCLGR